MSVFKPGRFAPRLWCFPLIGFVCCGCTDGTVQGTGRVLIEGQPAQEGQLLLTPVGGGEHAVGWIAPDGVFQLATTGNKKGIVPGKYTVAMRQKLVLAQKQQDAIKRRAAGLDLEELTVLFLGPRDEPIEIPPEGVADLVIDIRRDDGWQRSVGD